MLWINIQKKQKIIINFDRKINLVCLTCKPIKWKTGPTLGIYFLPVTPCIEIYLNLKY